MKLFILRLLVCCHEQQPSGDKDTLGGLPTRGPDLSQTVLACVQSDLDKSGSKICRHGRDR